MNCVLTSVTKRLCDNFFLAFMILTIAASILKNQLRIVYSFHLAYIHCTSILTTIIIILLKIFDFTGQMKAMKLSPAKFQVCSRYKAQMELLTTKIF